MPGVDRCSPPLLARCGTRFRQPFPASFRCPSYDVGWGSSVGGAELGDYTQGGTWPILETTHVVLGQQYTVTDFDDLAAVHLAHPPCAVQPLLKLEQVGVEGVLIRTSVVSLGAHLAYCTDLRRTRPSAVEGLVKPHLAKISASATGTPGALEMPTGRLPQVPERPTAPIAASYTLPRQDVGDALQRA